VITLRTTILVLATFMMAGCSTTDAARSASAPRTSPTATATASPSRTTASAFCLDLTTFKVGVTVFRGDVGKAIEGQRLDFKDLRKRAALIAHMGEEMRASAPPDIAKQFRTVLGAVKTSASKLKTGSSVRDVVDPLYGKRNQSAFDAVDKYTCGAGVQRD
jgi:hypothetical protein